ncbi:MAG: hypothetical protein A3G34_16605 [Candidatus Lindowbacteria bacterium RIFCSPLOWO2_12_FULL_62_27]|nr:MAG: hypothetical protein A3I06_00150 [Candidatus Lindowbacteria bacterium RIFCSPLOWO2_02_FULL_62_12]OGH62852.1 MAG: hypothetical protein A3G34_16605 [Candidatus Lindowbacteria bacterium RIFCSPLOWO2_12_FULL_62_27]
MRDRGETVGQTPKSGKNETKRAEKGQCLLFFVLKPANIFHSLLAVQGGKLAEKFVLTDKAALWMPVVSGGIIFASGVWLLAG